MYKHLFIKLTRHPISDTFCVYVSSLLTGMMKLCTKHCASFLFWHFSIVTDSSLHLSFPSRPTKSYSKGSPKSLIMAFWASYPYVRSWMDEWLHFTCTFCWLCVPMALCMCVSSCEGNWMAVPPRIVELEGSSSYTLIMAFGWRIPEASSLIDSSVLLHPRPRWAESRYCPTIRCIHRLANSQPHTHTHCVQRARDVWMGSEQQLSIPGPPRKYTYCIYTFCSCDMKTLITSWTFFGVVPTV